MDNLYDEHYKTFVFELAEDAIVADTISPQPCEFMLQWFPEAARILCVAMRS